MLQLSRFSRVWLCATLETAAHQAPRPWDSPGKNTGVGCHFLLQCMKVKSESEVTQSCPTLSYPMDCSLPGSSIHEIFQARVLEWVAIAFWAKNQPSKWQLYNFMNLMNCSESTVKVEKVSHQSAYAVQFIFIKRKSLYLHLYKKICVWVVR